MGEKQADDIARRRIRATKLDPTKEEVQEAYQEARTIISLHEDPTIRSGLEKHPILPGVTKMAGDRINAIVALRIDGFRDKAISDLLDIPQPEPHRLERNHPHAFAKAEMHALTQASRKYEIGVWGVRAALSEAGPRMVKVLIEIAEDKALKENVRKDAAIASLNLMGVGFARTSVGGRDSELSKAGANVFIQQIQAQEKEYAEAAVVEAEDVEFTEEDS